VRGLSLATLFLGLCLIDPGPTIDKRMSLTWIRAVVFFVALIVIWCGA
jgi:hypothetical protein